MAGYTFLGGKIAFVPSYQFRRERDKDDLEVLIDGMSLLNKNIEYIEGQGSCLDVKVSIDKFVKYTTSESARNIDACIKVEPSEGKIESIEFIERNKTSGEVKIKKLVNNHYMEVVIKHQKYRILFQPDMSG